MHAESLGHTSPTLAAFGNPLLDLCVRLADDTLLREFGLADDEDKEVTAQDHQSLLNAVHRLALPQESCTGGCALNTLRVFQWLVERPNCSVFFGAIGKDDAGKHLKHLVSNSGVQARFVEHSDQLTGSTVALIHKNFRTLVAHLGAAEVYASKDLMDGDKLIVAGVSLVYVESFFLSHSAAVVWEIIKLCKANGVAIAVNLNGSYLFEKHSEEIIKCIQFVDVVFGNESEYEALSKAMSLGCMSIQSIVTKVCEMGIKAPEDLETHEMKPLKVESIGNFGKIVVATRGEKPVVCGQQGKDTFEMPVLPLSGSVKDTTGAGDAFVAGFLKGLLERFSLNDCVLLGCYASSEIIQQIGCTPPQYSPLALTSIKERYNSKLQMIGCCVSNKTFDC